MSSFIIDFHNEAEPFSRIEQRHFTGLDKEVIYKKFRGHCAYCGQYLPRKKAYFDHVFPWAKGGASNIENGALSCCSCNIKKGKTGDKLAAVDVAALWFRRLYQSDIDWTGYLSEKAQRPIQYVNE